MLGHLSGHLSSSLACWHTLESLVSYPEADPLFPGHCLPSASGQFRAVAQLSEASRVPPTMFVSPTSLPLCQDDMHTGPRPLVPGDRVFRFPYHTSHLLPSMVFTASLQTLLTVTVTVPCSASTAPFSTLDPHCGCAIFIQGKPLTQCLSHETSSKRPDRPFPSSQEPV